MSSIRVGSFLKAAEEMGIPCIVTATDLMYICPKIIMTNTNGDLCEDAKGKKCNIACYDTGNHNEERMALSQNFLQGLICYCPIIFGNMIKNKYELNVKVIKHGMDYSGVKRQTKNITRTI